MAIEEVALLGNSLQELMLALKLTTSEPNHFDVSKGELNSHLDERALSLVIKLFVPSFIFLYASRLNF